MSDRIYCKRCQHFSSGVSDRYYEHCAKAKVSKVFTYYDIIEQRELPANKNAKNDCPDFYPRGA